MAATSNSDCPTPGLLVVRLSALGDVIHAMPAVSMLREAMPGLPLAWAVESPYREIVEIVARVPAIPASLKKWSRSPIAHRAEIAGFRKRIRGFCAAVDFQGLIKSAVIARASGAALRYGFDREAIREKPALLFINRPVPVDRTQHVVDWNIELARAIAPHATPANVDFSPFAADPEGKLADTHGSIVLLPGAGRPEKLWPAERFREVARHFGDRVLVVWGPGEESLARAIGGRVAPATNLRELAWVLLHAGAVLGADTGPLHLAAALGTKTVGLFGPTNPKRNGPYGQLDRCISSYDTTRSMRSIEAAGVIAMIERTLSE